MLHAKETRISFSLWLMFAFTLAYLFFIFHRVVSHIIYKKKADKFYYSDRLIGMAKKSCPKTEPKINHLTPLPPLPPSSFMVFKRFLKWHSPYLNSILLSWHFVNTFSTHWIWPSSNFLQQRKKNDNYHYILLGTRGGVNTVTTRIDLLSSAFHLFFLFGWQYLGPSQPKAPIWSPLPPPPSSSWICSW